MHIKSVAATCWLVPACWVAMTVSAIAGPICWIDHIAKADGGIDVYFIQKASLHIGIMENSGGISIRYTASNGVVRDEGGHAQDHLFVKDGVEFYASQLIHDSCSYKVSASEEVGKVTAKSAMHLPGLPPIFTAQIIGTDGTVAQTEASATSMITLQRRRPLVFSITHFFLTPRVRLTQPRQPGAPAKAKVATVARCVVWPNQTGVLTW